jgi:hypothetical protein
MQQERQERSEAHGATRGFEPAKSTPTWEEICQALRNRGWLPEFGARLPDDETD